MLDRRFRQCLALICCVLTIATAAWSHHPNGARSGPPTPAQERARQLVTSGIQYLTQQDYRKAAIDFQQAIQIDPEDADAYFSWGVALGALGQHQEEIARYEQAVRYNPFFGEAFVAWALALMQLGQEAEAKAKVIEALNVAPEAISPMQLMVLKSLGLVE